MDITGAQIQIINKAGFVQVVPLTDLFNEFLVKGKDVFKGDSGKSAYELSGFPGTLEEWIASLKGEKGDKGEVLEVIKYVEVEPEETEPPVFIPKPENPIKVFSPVGNTKTLVLDGKNFVTQNAGKNHSLNIETENPPFPEMRFEIRKGDEWPQDASRTTKHNRSELYAKSRPLPFKTDVWISYAMMIEPGDKLSYEWPKSVFFINQFKATNDKDDHEGGPMLSFTLHDECRVQLNSSSTSVKNHKTSPPTYKRAEKEFKRGEWINMVLRVVLDPMDGHLQWWANGEEVCNIKGIGTCFNDDLGPYFKFGAYRSEMEQTTAIRFKNVELNSNGSLADRVASPRQ